MRAASSYVAVSRETGAAVLETFSRQVAEAINAEKYRVLPIGEYLAELNARIRKMESM